MNRSFCITFALLFLVGCLQLIGKPAVELKAQDTAAPTADAPETVKQEEGEKTEPAEPEPKKREPVQLTKVTVIIEGEDVLKQEGIHEWAGKAAQLVTEFYPIFDQILTSEGFAPQKELTLIFRKMDGVAFASGTTITINADWIRRSPGDFGMVAHEMTHLIQRYPGGRGAGGIPTWAMEGLTDFMRHAYYEPDVLMRPVNLETAKWTDSYQITGGFFMWIEHAYDKEFISKLNVHARQRTYSDDIFEKYTGKKVDVLWTEYVEFLKTIEGTRILPTRDFGREKLGSTYSTERRPAGARPQRQ